MKIIKYRAYHSGQMLEVSAIDFKNRTIRVGGPVRIVRWRKDNTTDNGRINANGGEGTHFSSEMNGELSLDDPMQLPVYLMQYTGLKDKNKVEIFEGDIVKGVSMADGKPRTIMDPVIWWEFGWYVGYNYGEHNIAVCTLRAIHPIKVIGNIHKNPELLK